MADKNEEPCKTCGKFTIEIDHAYTQAQRNMGLDQRFGWVRFVRLDDLHGMRDVFDLAEDWIHERGKDFKEQECAIADAIEAEIGKREEQQNPET